MPRARLKRVVFHRALAEGLESRLLFAFGVTNGTAPTGQPTLVIDNGGDLKFSVINGGNVTSTLHLGDVSSIQYKGREMLASYSQTSRYSHYEQGLSSSTVITYTVNNAADWILVKCDDSAIASGAVIQYYAVRRNDNNIYLASLPIDVTNGPGEGRFIAYLDRSVFANPEAPSDNAGNSGAIEGSDVFGHADGTTTSKFYNMGRRMIENTVHGLTGSSGGINVGAWMYMGSREHSAGGPFFKDIDFQSGTAVEIYNCIFTGHTQTEPYRQGLHVYAFQFNDGSAPVAPDYSWMEQLSLQGWIASSQRGTLSGKATGVAAGHEVTVGLSNTAAQYWATPDASSNYAITGIQPGTYTETLYDTELAVGTRMVTITAGQATRADITNTYFTPSAANSIWRIGTWDGTPVGFLNADKIEIMHPSDVRMASWTSTPNFVVGTNTASQWPMIQFMGVNNSQRITFNLTSVQALTLRIGMTLGFEGGRVKPTVNAGQSYAWSPSNPAASTDLNSRGITRGTYRGPNQLYTFNIPTSALRVGTNTIDMAVISGSYVAGQTWLSPNVVYDAIDLVTTSSLTNAPRVTTITVSPTNASVGTGAQQQFTATAKDQFGAVTPANFGWSTTRGSTDLTGLYTAPQTSGSDTITATSGTVNGSASLNVVGSAPTVATAAKGTPNPVNNDATALSVLGADDGGEANLTYTWSLTGAPPASVNFSVNGTNAAKNTVATFTRAGSYDFLVTIRDAGGLTTTSATTVVVNQRITSISVSPTSAPTLTNGQTQQFGAAAFDQFGYALSPQPSSFTWNVTGTNAGSIDASGLYTAPASGPGSASITATSGDITSVAVPVTINLSVIRGTSADDAIRLARDGAMLNVYVNAPTTPTWTVAYASLGALRVEGFAGADTLTLDFTAGSPLPAAGVSFDGAAGANAIAIVGDAPAAGATITLTGGAVSLSSAAASSTATLSLLVESGSSLTLPASQHFASVNVNADASIALAANGSNFLSTQQLSIAAGASVDLNDNDLLLDYPAGDPSPLAAVQSLINSAQNNGTWDGFGLNSSAARVNASRSITLAAMEAAEYKTLAAPPATFHGLPLDDDAVIVKYTYYGDANFDGRVTFDDYVRIDTGFAQHRTGWSNGDFNGDGSINFDDYVLIDTAFNTQSATLSRLPGLRGSNR